MERLHQRFLNISLDTVLHPISRDVQQIVREQQNAADQEDLAKISRFQMPQPHSAKDIREAKALPVASKDKTTMSTFGRTATIIGGCLILGCSIVVGYFALQPIFNNFLGSSPTQTSPANLQLTNMPTKPDATQPFVSPTETSFADLPAASLAPTMTLTEQPEGIIGQIAFASDRDGINEIYIMNADGSEQKNLTNNPGSDWGPAWSPDGKKLAFVSDRDGNNEIYLMNSDGSESINITKAGSDDQLPVWSPDGKRIAFVSNRDGLDEIYIMESNGLGQTRLMNNSGYRNIILNNISWSPDSSMITFFSAREGTDWSIYVAYADGSGSGFRLTTNPGRDEFPCWSPNSEKIAFVATGMSSSADIYVVNADGSGLTALTGGTADELNPRWSPDGKRIAFISNQSENEDIYVMNSDGSELQLLTYSVSNFAFDWSSDSQQLVFATRKDDPIAKSSDIYIMDSDGTNQIRLTIKPTNDWDPVWRP